MSALGEPSALAQAIQVVTLVVVGCALGVLIRRQREHRSAATYWALAMFSGLALTVLLSLFPVRDDGSLLRHGHAVVLVSVFVLVPYLLVRLAVSLGAMGVRGHRVAVVLTLAQLLATVASPQFPQADENRSDWFTGYVVLVLVGWTAQSVLGAVSLWSAGRGQPAVVRRRLRALSAGALLLAAAAVAGAGVGTLSTGLRVTATLAAAVGVCLLVVAFVVPRWLAAAWRAADLARLGSAERGLMSAVSAEEVATAIVPAVGQLFGAAGAVLLDAEGNAVAEEGTPAEVVRSLALELAEHEASEVVVHTEDGGVACRLDEGWLVVRPSRFTPLFGSVELHLLDRVGSFADLALQRCRLFEDQARVRRATEATNAELQTIIYSVSHDLRNPIISVLGYLDVLAREHSGELSGDGEHYLHRISVNALYMQNLIQDLLELSRIGRSEPAPQAVSLGELAESVAQELRAMHPDCVITVADAFPVVWMSELRARQLLTNLMDNAAKYRGTGTKVVVRARPTEGGGAVLTVADDGRGIPAHLRERAFDVFERLEAAHTDVPGTGMGLPICKRVVDTLGGDITLDGPAVGEESGTTVTVTLPSRVVRGWTVVLTQEKEPAR